MAKAPKETKVEGNGTAVATVNLAIPAHLADQIKEDAGKGVSTASEDNIIPLIYVLQGQSPQVLRGPGAIEGARPGDLWLRGSAIKEIVSGEEGFEAIPCAFRKSWVEWIPRDQGGGFIARYPFDQKPKNAILRDPNDQNNWSLPNGHDLVETREHYLIANGQPYMMPFSSTGHTVSRTWMALMNQFRAGSGPAPSFSRKYKITTVQRTNSEGTWYLPKIVDMGWVTSAEYEVAKMLHEAVESGAKQAANPEGGGISEQYPADDPRNQQNDDQIPF